MQTFWLRKEMQCHTKYICNPLPCIADIWSQLRNTMLYNIADLLAQVGNKMPYNIVDRMAQVRNKVPYNVSGLIANLYANLGSTLP